MRSADDLDLPESASKPGLRGPYRRTNGMKTLSFRIWSDIWALPMFWRVTIGITFLITGIILGYVTEVLHVRPQNSSWGVLTAVVFVLAIVGATRFLKRQLSN
jgi:hypothetical protein